MSNFLSMYDFVLSAGPACKPAFNMRSSRLRICSTPQEWMMNYSLDTLATLFETGFYSFFSDYTTEGVHGGNHIVKCSSTNIISLHHFPIEKSVSEHYPHFIALMNKRIARMLRYCLVARSILFVCNREDSTETLLCFKNRISNLFKGKSIQLLNVRCCPSDGKGMTCEAEDVFCTNFIDVDIDKTKPGVGNFLEWANLLKNISISDRLQKIHAYEISDNKDVSY